MERLYRLGNALGIGSIAAILLVFWSPPAALCALAAAMVVDVLSVFRGRLRAVCRSGTVWLALGLTAAFGIERLIAASAASPQPALAHLDTSLRAVIGEGRVWTLFTAQCLHFNTIHLMLNLLGLVMFGARLERLVGRVHFLGVIAFAAALTPLSMVFERPEASLRGASGWISGIAAAWVIAPERWGARPSVAISCLSLWSLFSADLFLAILRPNSPFAHAGHLLGAAGGIAYGILLRRANPCVPEPVSAAQWRSPFPTPRPKYWRTRVHEAHLARRSIRAPHGLVLPPSLVGRRRSTAPCR